MNSVGIENVLIDEFLFIDYKDLPQKSDFVKKQLGNYYYEKKDLYKARENYLHSMGDPVSAYRLGMIYSFERSTMINNCYVFNYFKKSYEGGYNKAIVKLGVCYEDGICVKQDINRAIELYKEAVSKNVKEGFYWLVKCYESNGIEVDNKEKFSLIKVAVDMKYLPAFEVLSYYYRCGIGVEKDEEKAKEIEKRYEIIKERREKIKHDYYINNNNKLDDEYFDIFEEHKKLVYQKNYEFLINLGDDYMLGRGVIKDERKAVKRYQEAASLGYVDAHVRLSRCYMFGIGIEKDYEMSNYHLRLAAQKKHLKSMIMLADLLFLSLDIEEQKEAFNLYFEANEMGDTYAMRKVAECYYDGIGVEVDHKKVYEYSLKAAKKGDKGAYEDLAFCYDKGIGVDKNEDLMVYLYLKSDDSDAMKRRLKNKGVKIPEKEKIKEDFIVEDYLLKAEKGDIEAQYKLGLYYKDKVRLVSYNKKEKYKKEAIMWLEKASNQGHLEAKYHLGQCYLCIDEKKGLELWFELDKLGHDKTQFSLGSYYSLRVGRDNEKVIEYYKKAARQGNEKAINALRELFIFEF